MGISLKQNRIALHNLGVTFDAITNLNKAIKYYSEDKAGPAYISFEYASELRKAQIDRAILVTALTAQRDKLVSYLRDLGIEWDIE